jgi:GT2 family glycosyltransferase
MPSVAVVVVTWNSSAEIAACIAAAQTIPGTEIVVVDNASLDDTVSLAADTGVRVIANPVNVGFAAAVNQGVRATTAPLILLLNPDACYRTGINYLVEAFNDPDVGGAGGMTLDANGQPQTGFMARNLPTPALLVFEVLGLNRLFSSNPINRHYRCLDLDLCAASAVEQPAAAFFMFRRQAWQHLGGWDERFWPVWFEDVDFCACLKSAGSKVIFQPLAVAKHTGGHSIHGLPLEIREKYWYGSLLRYAAKHYPSAGFTGVCWAVAAGSIVRAVRGLPQHGFKAIVVYAGVFRQAVMFWLRAGFDRGRGRRAGLPS